MGNHSYDGLPPLIVKNWQVVPNQSNTFRNKLTHEYAHKHVINVEDHSQLQSFKNRIKQSNPYICRVLFYHQYHESIYHIYTQEMNDNLQKATSRFEQYSNYKFQQTDIDKWLKVKVSIIEAFWILAQTYGFMKICRQMIGCDSNGNWKVWINPDPCSHKPWVLVHLESEMLASLLSVLEQIQRDFDAYQQSLSHTTFDNITQFIPVIRTMKQQIEQKNQAKLQRKDKRTKNKTNSYIQNNTTNFNININIELDGQKKRENTLQKLFNPVVCETSRNDEREWKYINAKQGNTEKLGNAKERPISHFEQMNADKNMLFEAESAKRRGSDTAKSTKLIGFSCTNNPDILKNREKILGNQPTKISGHHKTIESELSTNSFRPNFTPSGNKSKLSLASFLAKHPKTTKIQSHSQSHYSKPTNNSSSNYFQYQNVPGTPSMKPPTKPSQNQSLNFQKNYYTSSNNKNVTVSSIRKQSGQNLRSMKEGTDEKNRENSEQKKIMNFPDFLAGHKKPKKQGKNISLEQYPISYQSQQQSKQGSTDNRPTTQQPPKTNYLSASSNYYSPNVFPTTDRYGNFEQNEDKKKNNKTLFEFYRKKYSQAEDLPQKNNAFGALDKRYSDKIRNNKFINLDVPNIRPRKNTNQNLKDQLANILDAPIHEPVSQDFQVFKNTKLQYKQQRSLTDHEHQNSQFGTNEDKDETEQIKKKVEEKKATFAHLKMEVMKMLEDDS